MFALAAPAGAQQGNGAAYVHVPSAADFARVYPAAARAQHAEGHVLLNCTILRTRRLSCTVALENPPGLGFGAAALELSREFRMAARTRDGRSTTGGHIRLPLAFTVHAAH
jgi:protein TonB